MKLPDKNITQWNAHEIADAVNEKLIDPSEIADSFINHIDKIDKDILAWETFDPEIFTRAILNSANKGKLAGVPFAVKDIFNTIDYPTQMGSEIWKDFTPGNNARVIDHFLWEGASILGKTVTAEFAVHTPGKTINPINQEYIVGTSSSGSAAAVASKMAPLALGTQTAGSTIRPSSYCGIFGYKPSFGLIPRTGILKTLDTLDHICLMARCVNDLRIALDVARVKGRNHPYIKNSLDSQNKLEKDRVYKIAFLKTSTWENAENYTKEAIEEFANGLSKEKYISIEEIEFSPELSTIHQNHALIYEKALSYYFSDEIENSRAQVSKIFLDMTDRGKKTGVEEYHQGLNKQVMHIKEFDELSKKYDFFMTNSVAGIAPRLDKPFEVDDPCLIWTYLHAPSITLPLFNGPDDMPFGLQMASSRYNDHELLDIAEKIEQKYIGE